MFSGRLVVLAVGPSLSGYELKVGMMSVVFRTCGQGCIFGFGTEFLLADSLCNKTNEMSPKNEKLM